MFGSGHGHGVGMSQYGSCGRALAGQSYDQILASYYRNTLLQRHSHDPTVRVLLGERDLDGCQDVYVYPQATMRNQATGGTVPLGPGAYRVRYLANGGLYRLVNLSTGDPIGSYRGPLRFESAPGGTLGYGGRHYRGSLIVVRSYAKLLLINRLPMELYVRGVLPNEMLPFWPAEALKSQAVVARSYALSTRRSDHFDCYADRRDQIYCGASSETPTTNEAASETALIYAVYDDKPIQALFHSSGAGCTEDASYVFNARPYLRAIEDVDPEGRPFEADARLNCPWTKWSGSIDPNASPHLNVGTITTLKVSARSPSGRATKVEVAGTQGKALISGEYNIRYKLKPTGLHLADGSHYPPGALPSTRISFFTV